MLQPKTWNSTQCEYREINYTSFNSNVFSPQTNTCIQVCNISSTNFISFLFALIFSLTRCVQCFAKKESSSFDSSWLFREPHTPLLYLTLALFVHVYVLTQWFLRKRAKYKAKKQKKKWNGRRKKTWKILTLTPTHHGEWVYQRIYFLFDVFFLHLKKGTQQVCV